MIALILTIFLIFFGLVRHLLHLYRMESYVKHLKSTHPLLPVVGTAYGMIGKSTTEVYKEYLQFFKSNDTPVKTYLGSTLIVMVDKPEDMKIIYSSPHCYDKPFIFDFFPYRAGIFSVRLLLKRSTPKKLICGNLDWIYIDFHEVFFNVYTNEHTNEHSVATTSAVWKPIRRHLNPTFNLKILQSFIPAFNEKAKVMLEKMDTEVEKGLFNVFPYIQWSILDAICGTTMGFELETQSNITTDFFDGMGAFFCIVPQRFLRPWLRADFIYKWTSMYKNEQKNLANLRLLTNRIFEAKKEEYLAETNNNNTNNVEIIEKKPKTLIDKLLTLWADGEFDEDDVKEQIETILVAGNDTTTTTISFAILMLAIHQEIQERVFHEIQSVFTTQNEDISDNHLNQMPYLDLVLKETMRLFPAGPYPFRSAAADIAISNCTIPKDTVIFLSIYSLQRRQDVWGEDAEKFNPDHFLPENMNKRHPFAFTPFGAGNRNCIGNRYGMISMKIMLTAMLRRYKFSTFLKMCDIDLRFELVLKPGTKHLVQIERRSW